MAEDKKPEPPPQPKPKARQAESVRRQREHIKALTGQDPLRGGVAD